VVAALRLNNLTVARVLITFNDPLTTGNFSRGRCALTRIPAGVWFEDADNIFQAHVIFFEKGFELLLELYFFLQRTIGLNADALTMLAMAAK
jgi:hypothetical protein|tara:strand:- start:1262 stop:1537 length:276 start_codon:yes stop_codon:yes gene_type:complete